MTNWRLEEPDNLFPTRRDAVLYLFGLGGFWGGIAAALVATDFGAPSSMLIVLIVAAIGSWFLLMVAMRKLEYRMTGRSVRPWPFGYARFRTQVIATLPSTVMAAAQRLKFNGVVVAIGVYSLLVIGFIGLVALSSRR